MSNQSILSKLYVLDINEALSCKRKVKSIVEVAIQFPTLVAEGDLDELDEQWHVLPSARNTIGDTVTSTTSVVSFWHGLRLIKDGNSRPKFDRLSKFMCDLLILPHSSACVERVFSQVNLAKTARTNRLTAQAVANRLLAKQAISRQGSECHIWMPSSSLISDVVQGRCYQRSEQKRLLRSQEETITLHDIAFDCADDVN